MKILRIFKRGISFLLCATLMLTVVSAESWVRGSAQGHFSALSTQDSVLPLESQALADQALLQTHLILDDQMPRVQTMEQASAFHAFSPQRLEAFQPITNGNGAYETLFQTLVKHVHAQPSVPTLTTTKRTMLLNEIRGALRAELSKIDGTYAQLEVNIIDDVRLIPDDHDFVLGILIPPSHDRPAYFRIHRALLEGLEARTVTDQARYIRELAEYEANVREHMAAAGSKADPTTISREVMTEALLRFGQWVVQRDWLERFKKERIKAWQFTHRRWKLTRPLIVVFGTARSKPGDPLYEIGIALGRLLYRTSFNIITGAGPGTMESVPRGFSFERQERGLALTLTILGVKIILHVGFEQNINPYLDHVFSCEFFGTRKWALYAPHVAAAIGAHGGIGTADEIIEVWRRGMWFILLGEEIWRPFVEALCRGWRNTGLWSHRMENRFMPDVVATPEMAVDALEKDMRSPHRREPRPKDRPELFMTREDLNRFNQELEEPYFQLYQGPESVVFIGRPNPEISQNDLDTAGLVAQRLARQGTGVRIASRGPLMDAITHAVGKLHRRGLVHATLFLSQRHDTLDTDLTEQEKGQVNQIIATREAINHRILLTRNAQAYIFLPGTLGTLNVLFDILCQMQTGKLPRKPIVLLDSHHLYKPFFEAFLQTLLTSDPQMISPRDIGLMTFAETEEDVWRALNPLRNAAHHMRRFLNSPYPDEALRTGQRAYDQLRGQESDMIFWDPSAVNDLCEFLSVYTQALITRRSGEVADQFLRQMATHMPDIQKQERYWLLRTETMAHGGNRAQWIRDLENVWPQGSLEYRSATPDFLRQVGILYADHIRDLIAASLWGEADDYITRGLGMTHLLPNTDASRIELNTLRDAVRDPARGGRRRQRYRSRPSALSSAA